MTSDSQPVLEVRDLSKAYRRRFVLRDVGFSVHPGEAMAVVGPNGAGKSTLLGCITGDRRPDAGSITVCRSDALRDLAAAARCIGFVPERPFLYDELTVGELLGFVGEARGIAPDAATAEIDRLLDLLGMSGAEAVLCRELSQGMGRKTAITAALLHRPRAILLDEALNGLDRTSAARLTAELEARRADGAAVLLSSHDLDFVAEWCDRAVLLAPGARWTVLEGEAWERWRRAPTLELAG